MINPIEAGYLRTQDSLSKRERRERRHRPVPRAAHSESALEHLEGRPRLEEERESATLDLVA